jgi:MFS family permease
MSLLAPKDLKSTTSISFSRFGRKEPLVVACVMQAVFGSACAFMPWFEGFLVMRFLTAAAVGGSMVTSFVICKYLLVRLSGLVVGVPGCRCRGPDSIPGYQIFFRSSGS